MKKISLIIILIFLFFCSGLQAQSPDDKIGALINNSDYFGLDEQYPLLKDSIHPMLKVFSGVMLSFSFNNPRETCMYADSLIKNHQQEIGFGNVQSMIMIKSQSLAEMGEYEQAANELKSFTESVSQYMDSASLNSFNSTYQYYNKLSSVPKCWIERLGKNCESSIEIDTVRLKGKTSSETDTSRISGTLIYIPVKIGDNVERFILDTGCPTAAFLSERMAQKYNVKTVFDSLIVNGTGSGYGRLGLLDSIEVAGIILKNLLVTVVPSNPTVDSVFMTEAVLGQEIMKLTGEIQIYPRQKKVIFPWELSPTPSTGRNMIFHASHPYIKAFHNNERLIMHFDTGNSSGNLHYTYYEKHKEKIERTGKKDSRLTGGFGAVMMKEIYRLPSFDMWVGDNAFTLKDFEVNITPIYTVQGREDGALGMSFINLFDKVTINFHKMFVDVE